MTWFPYQTHRPHANHPAGSNALVREDPTNWRIAELKFEDGETIQLGRQGWNFPGTPLFLPHDLMLEEIYRAEDQNVFKAIDDAFRPSGLVT